MLSIELAHKVASLKESYWSDDSIEGYVVFLNEDFETFPKDCISGGDITKIETSFFEAARKDVPSQKNVSLKDICEKHQFKGKLGQKFAFTDLWGERLVTIVFIGLGKQSPVSEVRRHTIPKEIEKLRRAVGAAILKLRSLKIKKAVLFAPNKDRFKISDTEVSVTDIVKQVIITSYMASYDFTKFKSKKDDEKKEFCIKLFLAVQENRDFYEGEESLLDEVVKEAEIIGKAVNEARHLCDMPPNIANPTYVGAQAKNKAVDTPGLKCAVFWS